MGGLFFLPRKGLTEDSMETKAAETSDRIGVVIGEPAEAGSQAVAIWLGVKLELPSGRSLALLICNEEQDGGVLFVEGVRGPSDEDEDMVPCPRCGSPHYVVSLVDAIEEELLDVKESVVCVHASKLVALTLRDVEAIAKARPQRKGRR